MRTIGKRKSRNQPCKSPSPDIANRSIIQNTCIEVHQIKAKIRQAQQKQKSIKFQLESSFSQIVPSQQNSTALKYRQVYEQLNQMKKLNHELREDNLTLNEENIRLRGQRNNIQIIPLANSISQRAEESPLKQKIVNLDSERRNLLQELNVEKSHLQHSERTIEHLRINQLRLKQEIDRLVGVGREGENRMAMLAHNMTILENNTNGKLNQLNAHINQIRTLERVISEKHSRILGDIRVHQTPSTGKHALRDAELTGSRERDPQSILYLSPLARSKDNFSVERVEEDSFNLKEELRVKKHEVQSLKQETERLRQILHSSQSQSQPQPVTKISTPKFIEGGLSTTFQQLASQASLVRNYQAELSQLQQEKDQMQEKMELNSKQSEEEMARLAGVISHHKKLLKGYEGELKHQICQLCVFKDKEIQKLRQMVDHSQQQYRQDFNSLQQQEQTTFEEFKLKIREHQSKNAQENTELNQKCQSLSQSNQSLTLQLGNVREKLMYIKDNIQLEEATRLLDENYSLFSELEGSCSSKNLEFERMSASFREKLYMKEQHSFSLESELTLKTKEVEVLRTELGKLKELKEEFGSFEPMEASSVDRADSGLKLQQDCKFRKNQQLVLQQLQEGTQKLSILCLSVLQFIGRSPPASKDSRGRSVGNSDSDSDWATVYLCDVWY